MKKILLMSIVAILSVAYYVNAQDGIYNRRIGVSNEAYNATTWDGVTGVAPSKDAVRDKIEALPSSRFSVTDITGQTDDTTPATSATAVLAQGGSLIESTVQQIVTAGLLAQTATAITVASGVVTIDGSINRFYTVAGEGGVADTVTTITCTGTCPEKVYFFAVSDTVDIAFNDTSGGFIIPNGSVVTASTTSMVVEFVWSSALSKYVCLTIPDTINLSALDMTAGTSSIPSTVTTSTGAQTAAGPQHLESDTYIWSIGDGDATPISLDFAKDATYTFPASSKTLAATDHTAQYSATPVIDDPDNFAANFTGDNLYGGTFIANAAGTAALPEPAVGMNFTYVLEGANANIIDPLGTGTADTIVMNGLAAAADENITSSTSGAICVFQYRAANSWMATCKNFVEATPP